MREDQFRRDDICSEPLDWSDFVQKRYVRDDGWCCDKIGVNRRMAKDLKSPNE